EGEKGRKNENQGASPGRPSVRPRPAPFLPFSPSPLLSTLMRMAPDIVTEVPRLAPRDPDANKGDFGRVLLAAGSRGMSGAAVLCASAALGGGAGLVRVAVPTGALPIVAAGNPCCMTAPLSEDEHGRLAVAAAPELVALLGENTAAGMGPGLGRGDGVSAVV